MWKNVRAIIALISVAAYCLYSGYETYLTGSVPQHFYVFVAGIGAFYFYTRVKEGRLPLTDDKKAKTT